METHYYHVELMCFDCRGLRQPDAAVEVMALVRQVGLVPATGAWTRTSHPTPIDDLAAYVATHRLVDDLPASARRLRQRESVAFGVLRPTQPLDACTMSISLRHPDIWLLNIALSTSTTTGEPLETYYAAWGDVLEGIGAALYARARPVISWLAALPIHQGPGESGPFLEEAADERRLIVGWRTWYGPAYIEAIGHEVLQGLPDRIEPLADGGIAHRLDAPLATLVWGEAAPYEAVRAYLGQVGIEPAWPDHHVWPDLLD